MKLAVWVMLGLTGIFSAEAQESKEEITLGKVATNTSMATPCSQSRRNFKAEMLEIEAEIKKSGKDGGSI